MLPKFQAHFLTLELHFHQDIQPDVLQLVVRFQSSEE